MNDKDVVRLDKSRFFFWVGMACIKGTLYGGIAYLIWGNSWYVPTVFIVTFAAVMLAGGLCCATRHDLEC